MPPKFDPSEVKVRNLEDGLAAPADLRTVS